MLSIHHIQQLRDLSIVGVAERLGLPIKRNHTYCPFHDDHHPSLTFNTHKNTFRCFVCDAHGSTIDLVMMRMGMSFLEACKWLANENNIVQETWKPAEKTIKQQGPKTDVRHLKELVRRPYLNEEARAFLFGERKITPEVANRQGLSSISTPVPMSGNLHEGWFNAPSLLIPYCDTEGEVLSVQARYLGHESGKPRFQFPKGGRCTIYNLPVIRTLNPGEMLWVTEGVSDCLAMLSSGRKAIAVPSATLLKPGDAGLLREMNLHMVPDRDKPGERLFLELKAICPAIVCHPLPYGFKDFGQYWATTQNVDMLPC